MDLLGRWQSISTLGLSQLGLGLSPDPPYFLIRLWNRKEVSYRRPELRSREVVGFDSCTYPVVHSVHLLRRARLQIDRLRFLYR